MEVLDGEGHRGEATTAAPQSSRRLTPRQVNLALAALLLGLFATGLTSWAVGSAWSRLWTVTHATLGFCLVLLLPRKTRTSVRTGLRRHPGTRWISATMGVLVLATIALGVAHSWGLWYGVGYWSALWTHTLLAFVVLPFLLWHIWNRPSRPRQTDFGRRNLLKAGTALVGAAAFVGVAEGVTRTLGKGSRRFTGSREIASFDPQAMPAVSWIDDESPDDVDPSRWQLRVAGEEVDVASLWDRCAPVTADLDCTGGWWSRQHWQAIPLSELFDAGDARSVQVTSATGFRRAFPADDLDQVYLAVGYGDEPLRRRHGAPVRIVAPGRRGPWWVKWVVEIEPSSRPWWVQFPFPLT